MTNDQTYTKYGILHTAYSAFLLDGYYGALLRQITRLIKGLSQNKFFIYLTIKLIKSIVIITY